MTTVEIIAIIKDLPREQREEILTHTFKGMTAPYPDIEKAWAKEARRHLDDFEQGRTEAITGDQVMKELKRIVGK